MRIGVDASRAARGQRTGPENYSLHLIRHLLRLIEEAPAPHRVLLYFNQVPDPDLFPAHDWCLQRVMPYPRLWTHCRLSWEMATRAPDVLFVPAHVLPLVHPRRCVVTIHDLGYLYYPRAYHRWNWLYLHLSTIYNARAARCIIADSEVTKRDLVERLRVPADKVTVVYPGVEEAFQPQADAAVDAVREKYQLRSDYILYVGTLQPRKNVVRLLDAFFQLRDSGQLSAQLVLAGRKGWLHQEITRRLSRSNSGVVLTGYVPPDELPALYAGATVFILPSLFEGFGFPVVEAMACGTPVIAANASSLPEVVGDAALLMDPLDTRDIARALLTVLSDAQLREELQ
ncbi:MAG: glycosyltransferase family 1 protein, partial [Chloroflexota bacterium]